MGVLDDAIREHLDLKRSRGADPTEIERLEREALGPVRRDPVLGGLRFDDASEATQTDASAHDADSHPEYHDSTAPHWQGDHFEEHLDPANGFAEHHEEAVEPEQPKRRGFLRRRGGSSHEPDRKPERKPVVEPEHFWPEDHDEADHLSPQHYEPEYFPQGHFEPEHLRSEPIEPEHAGLHEEDVAHIGDGAELTHDDGPVTELHQVVALEPLTHPLDEPSDVAPPTREEAAALVESEVPVSEPERQPEPELKHPLGPLERVAPELAAPEPAGAEPPSARTTAPGPEIEAKPRGSSATPPPLAFENPPRRPRFSTEPPGLEPSEPVSSRDDSRKGRAEPEGTSEFDVQEHLEGEALDEDVLEETPEFLQDTPEHDRLWFEQRPPRDFDFDG
jgi:hypothetical protein